MYHNISWSSSEVEDVLNNACTLVTLGNRVSSDSIDDYGGLSGDFAVRLHVRRTRIKWLHNINAELHNTLVTWPSPESGIQGIHRRAKVQQKERL
jgi:hypothetical protein